MQTFTSAPTAARATSIRRRWHERNGLRALLVAAVLAGAIGGTLEKAVAQDAATPTAAAADVSGSFVVHELVSRHSFEADGSGVVTLRVHVVVNDRAGVSQWGVVSVPYLATFQEVELNGLSVTKPDGQRISVADAPLEDVRLTGQFDEPVFADFRAKRAVVPSLQPGDRLEYAFTVRSSRSLLPGHFWADHSFFRLAVVLKEVFEVEAPASRQLRVAARRGRQSEPEQVGEGRVLHRWTHSQAAPDPDLLDPKRRHAALQKQARLGPDVRVSSFETWEELGSALGRMTAERAQPDDALRQRARELTKAAATPDDRLAALFTYVSQQVRYIGLAFGEGRLEPRPAATVLASQYGDCKDKHVLLASLAAAIGIETDAVLVSSSLDDVDERVPTPAQFDHLVTVVRRGASAETWLWLDSTSGVLPPGALMAPFRGKRGLLATSGQKGAASALVHTPEDLPSENRTTVNIAGRFAGDGAFTARVTRTYQGDEEFALRSVSPHLDEQGRQQAAQDQADADGFNEPELADVTITDAGPGRGIEFRYDVRDTYGLESEKPWRLWLIAPRFDLPAATDDREAIELGVPRETVVTARYELPVALIGPAPLAVTLNRPYAAYRSAYRVEGTSVTVERSLRILQRTISPDLLDDFRAFGKALEADYQQRVQVNPVPKPAPGDDADALNRRGNEAIDRRDYAEAIRLLERAVALNPDHRWAWNNLGRAHRANGDPKAAVPALERQIAINKYDQYAYTNLGLALWDLGDRTRAREQFEKQLEVNPLDKWAHANLGGLYLELKDPRASAASSERAVSVDPDYTYAWRKLAFARLELGEHDGAIEAFRHVIRLSPTPDEKNGVAYTLAQHGVALDEAQRLAGEAIDETIPSLRDTPLDRPGDEAAARTRALSAYWDTLGWVYFRRGDYEAARRYVGASWAINGEPEVAEHLAMTHEKLGNRDLAVAMYATAAHTGKRAESRAALERLVGREQVGRTIDAAVRDIVNSRVVLLGERRPGAKADLYIVTDEAGRILAVRLLSGDEAFRRLEETLLGTQLSFAAPAEGRIRLTRRATVRCPDNEACVLRLDVDPARVPG